MTLHSITPVNEKTLFGQDEIIVSKTGMAASYALLLKLLEEQGQTYSEFVWALRSGNNADCDPLSSQGALT